MLYRKGGNMSESKRTRKISTTNHRQSTSGWKLFRSDKETQFAFHPTHTCRKPEGICEVENEIKIYFQPDIQFSDPRRYQEDMAGLAEGQWQSTGLTFQFCRYDILTIWKIFCRYEILPLKIFCRYMILSLRYLPTWAGESGDWENVWRKYWIIRSGYARHCLQLTLYFQDSRS